MKEKKYSYKNAFSDAKFMLSFVWKCSKALFFLKIFEILKSAFALVVNAYSIKIIIDSLIDGADLKRIIIIIVIIQGIIQLLYTIDIFIVNMLIPRIEYKIRNKLQNVFIEKSVKVDLENYENTEFYDHYTKAMKIADNKALAYINYIKDIISAIINMILVSFIITRVDLYMLVFIGAIVILTIIDQKYSIRYSSILYDSEESINRRMNYIKNIAHNRKYAKEVRAYDLGKFLLEKHNIAFDEKYKVYKRINRKYWSLKYTVATFRNFLLVIGLLVYVSFLVINKKISIGDFSLVIGAIFLTAKFISDITNSLEQIKHQGEFYVSHLKVIFNSKSEIETEVNKNEVANMGDKNYRIEFKNVYFKYPSHEGWVLEDINFVLNSGDKLAIVGKNGAGKSTIIKLLLRLYDVTKGEILFNDQNIKNISVKELRKSFSIILQDFNIYSFTVAENILMDFYDESKKDEIEKSLKLFGLDIYVKKHGDVSEVYINRDFDEKGIGLSDGMMQQLAISRAMISEGHIALFDEPNSSLDPLAEHELNNKIISKLNDKSAIFVTHRLSTAVMADRIILIDKGKILETGSHKELIEKHGLYYEMYEKQNLAFKIARELDNNDI